ncbi:ABC transporter ATP-binding protein [Caldisericum exile]|uniref:ABC transporter n=1 Tax=Caldisericum exile (strain DSM 21853 / NBRC 104410 / AZM16c01) TaxID=511051 RepID=A0A7U6GE10_CALEA|nr:ABC transporter ATP-binding protein [Caldisericum exile]BAL80654.1 putative ABC transporter [Caldisericum exile AZM16c01]
MQSLLKLYANLKKYLFLIVGAVFLIYLQVRANLELPTIMSKIVNNGILPGDINYIWQQGMFMLFIAGLGILASIAANFLTSHVSMGLGRDIRSKFFKHVESFSLYEFNKFGASTLLTRTSNDVVQIQQSTQMLIMMLSNAIFTGIDALILAYNASPYLTRVLYVAIPTVALIIVLFINPVTKLFLLIQKEIDKINRVVRENIMGVRVIRAFNKTEYEKKRFDVANLDVTNTYIRANRIMAVLMPLLMIGMNLATVAIIWYGAKGIDLGNTNLGSMVAFIQYAMMILMSIVFLTILFVMLPRAVAASERIVEVLETPIEIKDREKPKTFPDEKKGSIQFINVSFKYPNAEEPVLRDITFEAKPGEVVGILGTTGSGKSTLVSLIPRLYDVTSGQLLIDGVDVREVPQEELRRRISYVPQRAVIFTGTVKENIRIGKPDATDEEIIEAAKIAQAHAFIERLQQGYDTIISEGGTNLSGGQKQRISIARGIIRKGDIFVFDDCFSALDFKTEAKLRAALKDVIKGSTVILVAQRVASVMSADKIVVLDEGRIVGIGTHKELLNSSEVYREIVFSQLSQEDLVREGLA